MPLPVEGRQRCNRIHKTCGIGCYGPWSAGKVRRRLRGGWKSVASGFTGCGDGSRRPASAPVIRSALTRASVFCCSGTELWTMPPWRQSVILWQMQLPNDSSWRRHGSLQGKFNTEYPDDLEVFFRDFVAGRSERMWVRVISFDQRSLEYLGVLLNSPDLIRANQEGDNVAFTLPQGTPYPV